ncbi:MAG TPA: FAD binding domain-containing protein, partial [Methylomirabilota bacterium]|nr:FAD binding domain-containing protein [Methylomirabilota bacterium]
MYNFNYVRPASLADAAKALGASADAKIVAGGQTLLPTMKQRLAQPSDLVDLGGIAELKGIKVDGNTLTIGAMTTHNDVAHSADVKKTIPALAALAEGIGDPQVRNRGTIGGSISNNDPAADYPSSLVALNATVTTNKRKLAAEEFFKGLFETALGAGEIVTAVSFP